MFITVETQRELIVLRKEGDEAKLKDFYAKLGYDVVKELEKLPPEIRFRIYREGTTIEGKHWWNIRTGDPLKEEA